MTTRGVSNYNTTRPSTEVMPGGVAVYVAAPRLTTASSSPSALRLQFTSSYDDTPASNNMHHCRGPSSTPSTCAYPQVSIPRSRRLLRQQHTLLQRSAKYNANTDGNIASSSSSSSDFSEDDENDHGFDPSTWVTMGGGDHHRIHIEDSGGQYDDDSDANINEGGGGDSEGSFKTSLATDILHTLIGTGNGGQVPHRKGSGDPRRNNNNIKHSTGSGGCGDVAAGSGGSGDVAVVTSLFGASGTGKSSLYFGAVRGGGDMTSSSDGGAGVIDMVIHRLLHPDTYTPSNPTATTACPSTGWKPSSKAASAPNNTAAGRQATIASSSVPAAGGRGGSTMTPAQLAAQNLRQLIQADKVNLRRAWHQTSNTNNNDSLHNQLSVANLRAASPDTTTGSTTTSPTHPPAPAVDVLLSVVESRPIMLRVPVPRSPPSTTTTTALLNQSCGSLGGGDGGDGGDVGGSCSWEWEDRVVMVNVDLISGKADLEPIAKSLVRELGGGGGADHDNNDDDDHRPPVRGVFCSLSPEAFIAGPSSSPSTTTELTSALLPIPTNHHNNTTTSSPHYLLCSTSEDFSNSLTACLARSGSWCVPGGSSHHYHHHRSHGGGRGDSEVLEVPTSTITGGVDTVLSALRGHLSSTSTSTPPLSPSSKATSSTRDAGAAAGGGGKDTITTADGMVPKLHDGDVLTPSATGTKNSIVITIALRSQGGGGGGISSSSSASDRFAVWKIFDLAGPPVGRFHHTPATSSATNTYNHIVRYYRTLHHQLSSTSHNTSTTNNTVTYQRRGSGSVIIGASSVFYNTSVPLTNSQFGSSSTTTLMLQHHRQQYSSAPSTPSTSASRDIHHHYFGGGTSPSSRGGGGRRRTSMSIGSGVNDSMALSEGGWSVMNTSMMGGGGSVYEGSGGRSGHRSFHCPVAASLIYLLNASNTTSTASTPSIAVHASLLCCLRQDGLFDHSNRLSLLVAKTAQEHYLHSNAPPSSLHTRSREPAANGAHGTGGGGVSSSLGLHYASLVQHTLAFQDSASTRNSPPHPTIPPSSTFMWTHVESLIKAAQLHNSSSSHHHRSSDLCTVRVPGEAVAHWPNSLLYRIGRPVRPASSSSLSSYNKSVPFFDLTFPRKILLDLLCCNGAAGSSSSSRRPITKSPRNYNNNSQLDQHRHQQSSNNIPSIFTQHSDTDPLYELLSLLLSTKTFTPTTHLPLSEDTHDSIVNNLSCKKEEEVVLPYHFPFIQGALEHHIATTLMMPTSSSSSVGGVEGKRRPSSPPRLHVDALQSAVSSSSTLLKRSSTSQSTSPLTKHQQHPFSSNKDVSPSASMQSDMAPPSSVSMGNASSRSVGGGRRVSIDVPSPPASPRQVLLKGFTTTSRAATDSMECDGSGGTGGLTSTTINTTGKRTVVSTNLLSSKKASLSQSRSDPNHRPDDDIVEVQYDDDDDTTSGSMSDRPHQHHSGSNNNNNNNNNMQATTSTITTTMATTTHIIVEEEDYEDMEEPTGIDAEEEDYPSDWDDDDDASSVAASTGVSRDVVSESERAIRAEQAALLKHLLEPSNNGPLPGIDDGDNSSAAEDERKEGNNPNQQHQHTAIATNSGNSNNRVIVDDDYEDDYEHDDDAHHSNVVSNSSTDTTAPTTLEDTMPSAAAASRASRNHTTTSISSNSHQHQQHQTQRPSWLVGLDVAMQSVRAGASSSTQPTTTILKGGVESRRNNNTTSSATVAKSSFSPTRSKSASKSTNHNTSITTPSVSNNSDRLHRTETASTAPKRLSARIHGRNATQVAAAAHHHHHNGGAPTTTTAMTSSAVRSSYADVDYSHHHHGADNNHTNTTTTTADSLHLGPHDILSNVAYVKGILAEASRLDDEDGVSGGSNSYYDDDGDDNTTMSNNGTLPSTIYPNPTTKVTSSSSRSHRHNNNNNTTTSNLEKEVQRLRRELNAALTENERCMRFMEVDVAGPLIDYYERATSVVEDDGGGMVSSSYNNKNSNSSYINQNNNINISSSVLRRSGSHPHHVTQQAPPSRRLEDTLEVIRSIGSKCMSQAEGSRMLLSSSSSSSRAMHHQQQQQRQRSARHETSVLMDGVSSNNVSRGDMGCAPTSSANVSFGDDGLLRSHHQSTNHIISHNNNNNNTSRHSNNSMSATASRQHYYYDAEALSRRDESSLYPHHDTYQNEEGNATNPTGTFRKVLNSSGVMYQRASAATKESSRRHAEATSEIERLQRENSRLVKMVSGQDVLCRGLKDQLSAANERNAALAARLHTDTSAGLIADLFTSACDSPAAGGHGGNGSSVVSVTGPPPRGHHGLQQSGDGNSGDGGLMLARTLQTNVHEVFRYVENAFDTVVDQLQRRTKHSSLSGGRSSSRSSLSSPAAAAVMTEGQVEALLRTVISAKEEFKASIVPGVVEAMEDVQRELVSATTREQQYLHMVLQ